MIGRNGERGSGISVLAARHDDDDDDVRIYYVRQWSRRLGFNPRSRHTKDSKKWYLIPPCLALSIIR